MQFLPTPAISWLKLNLRLRNDLWWIVKLYLLSWLNPG